MSSHYGLRCNHSSVLSTHHFLTIVVIAKASGPPNVLRLVARVREKMQPAKKLVAWFREKMLNVKNLVARVRRKIFPVRSLMARVRR